MCAIFLADDKVSRKKILFGYYDDPVLAVGRSGIGPGPLFILEPSFRLRRAEFRLKRFLISVGCVSFSNCVEGWGRILFEFRPCG